MNAQAAVASKLKAITCMVHVLHPKLWSGCIIHATINMTKKYTSKVGKKSFRS